MKADTRPAVKHEFEHAEPALIHDPEQDMTILARWLHRGMQQGPRFWYLLGGVVVAVILVGTIVAVAVLTRGGQPGKIDASAGSSSTAQAPDGPGVTDPPPTSVTTAECEEGPGRRVEQLEDVVVPAVEVPPVLDDDGEEVLPGFTVPAALVDAGCVIRYDAPGGCLGAVRVTGASRGTPGPSPSRCGT